MNLSDKVLSVSDISAVLKQTIESEFDSIRVEGEVSTLKKAPSGHIYFSLKDSKSVLNAIVWRGKASLYGDFLEEGALVVCQGKLSIFAGRSNYQMIVDTVTPSGEGDLLKQLELLKKKLEAEGLFSPLNKKELPFLPKLIGVVTSPSGAVIRDIMHRLKDRFPRHVLLYPVLVQGEGAARQIATAIREFNNFPVTLPSGETLDRPDLLIVARGGGSLEDLWCFNDEEVVRATAESDIPIISAVGHETDTTLIDYASDLRAPTPTGAAEKAVPVREDILLSLEETDTRLKSALKRCVEEKNLKLESVARGLPNLQEILNMAEQRLDDVWERLGNSFQNLIKLKESALEMQTRLLQSCSYKKVLERGFALALTDKGEPLSSVRKVPHDVPFKLSFYDGDVAVKTTDNIMPMAQTTPVQKAPLQKTQKKKSSPAKSSLQGDLFS